VWPPPPLPPPLLLRFEEECDAEVLLARAERMAADADASLATAAKLQAIAAKNSSETAAAVSGSYLTAILAAIGGSTWAGALTIQVASRTALGALAGMTAGTQVYLSERGYEGPLEFVAGDQSAQITADTYHALWYAPTAAPTGASGAWRRIHYGLAQASWASVIASGIGNYSAQINALLAHADVAAVELPAGTIGNTAPILVPSGKLLFGKGIDATILKATATTGYVAGAGIYQNAIVNLVSGSVGARARDFTVEGNKLGSHTIGGVHQIQSKQALVERVYAKNCSAYAFWAVTNFVYTADATSGVFRNCWVENCNVSFEATAAQNILFERCHARDGDGDIAPTIEAMFHPITGSKNITYRDCTAISNVVGAAAHVAAYTAEPVQNITFENCTIKTTNGSVAFAVDSFSAAVSNLRIINCDIQSATYLGINAVNATGGIDLVVDGGRVQARAQGIIGNTGTDMTIRGTWIIMNHSDGTGAVAPVVADPSSNLVLDGPIFDTDRAFTYPQSFPSQSAFRVLAPPIIRVSAGAVVLPMGVGHKLTRVVATDEAHNSGASLIGTGANAFTFSDMPVGTFKVRVEGSYQTSATSNGLGVGVQSSGSVFTAGYGQVDGRIDGTSSVHGVIRTNSAVFGPSTVSNSGTPLPFILDFIVRVTAADGGGLTITAGAYQGIAGYGGSATVKAGTMMTIERIA
jgi:hypothetical protein